MTGNLVLATDRGIWRTAWPPPPGESGTGPLTVDAPRERIAALGAVGNRACAVAEGGRSFVWDGGAMMWRETSPWPNAGWTPLVVLPMRDGSIAVGASPVAIWRMDPDGERWTQLGELAESLVRGAAAETGGSPRVRALCEDGAGGLLAGIDAGGLWHWDSTRWRAVAAGPGPERLPSRVLSVARDPGLLGGFVVGTAEGSYHIADLAGPAERRPVASATAAVTALEGSRKISASALAAASATVIGALGTEAAGIEFDGHDVLLATQSGELWRIPLRGPRPRKPWLEALPRLHGMALLDEDAAQEGPADGEAAD